MSLQLKRTLAILTILLVIVSLSNQYVIKSKRQSDDHDHEQHQDNVIEEDLVDVPAVDEHREAFEEEIHEEPEIPTDSNQTNSNSDEYKFESDDKNDENQNNIKEETTPETIDHENEDFDKNGQNQALEENVSQVTEPEPKPEPTSKATPEPTSKATPEPTTEPKPESTPVLTEKDKKIESEETEFEDQDPHDLLEANKLVREYEAEATKEQTTVTTTEAPKQTIWFRPNYKSVYNDSLNDESHITANCPSLTCEFGYKTDLFGKPICSCFNPCNEKKCGSNICKIEKLADTKYIGACYDPSKIERPLHCHLPIATGTCKNYTSRFYFNSFLQRCTHFIYTGCNGNANNFEKWEKCEMECNTCSLPAAPGPCHGNIIRYYYDSARRECVAFNWGGCKGNENNFSTRKHCEDSCIFRKEGALFLNGMPKVYIRKYHGNQN